MNFGQVLVGGVPNFLDIYSDVAVDQDIAHAADPAPIEIRECGTQGGAYALRCFADYFEIADDGILLLFGPKNGSSPPWIYTATRSHRSSIWCR